MPAKGKVGSNSKTVIDGEATGTNNGKGLKRWISAPGGAESSAIHVIITFLEKTC
jgi:hypothetical protein